jgi:acetyl-CoA carboxylase carboxyltransferase component
MRRGESVPKLDAWTERARLDPRQRLELLADEGSLQVIRSAVLSQRMGTKARRGDGVLGASARIGGRPVFCFAQDAATVGGSVGAAHAETIVRILRLAGEACTPVIGFVESGGARMQEGVAALAGYGRIFRENVSLSGRVPQISVVTGPSAGGGCYSPALNDFVVMTKAATMSLTGPAVVREVTGEATTPEELGGHRVHARNGVCHLVAEDDVDAVFLTRALLGYLPQSAWDTVPLVPPVEPEHPDPARAVPEDGRAVYDVREVVRALVDAGSMLEIAPSFARNIVVAFARLGGAPVGVVANQPRHLGGVIEVEGAQKAARFVRTCNAFGVPLVALVDTPGFMPGCRQESMGAIRHGAKLLYAFAEATVPRVTVVLRKAYGGAYITMNSKDLGADLTLAWPHAEIGIMGARQAAGILARRALAEASDPEAMLDRCAAEYAEEHLTAERAAAAGAIDEVIDPDETRGRLTEAIAILRAKRPAPRQTGNCPL